MGPLAALGDGFFWLSLRPAAGALCAALVPWLGAWAAVLFLVLYNVVHFTLRGWLFRKGLQLGDRLVEAVARARLPSRGAKLRAVAAASAGAAAAYLAFAFGAQQGGVGGGCWREVVSPWGRSVTFWSPGRFPPPFSPPRRRCSQGASGPGCRMHGES